MENKPLSSAIQSLSDAISDSGLRVTFGLQSDQINRIEELKKDWELKEIPDPLFNYNFWELAGKELGWDKLTLALYYFKHLSKITP